MSTQSQRQYRRDMARIAVKRQAALDLLCEGDPDLRRHLDGYSYAELVAMKHGCRQRVLPTEQETQ